MTDTAATDAPTATPPHRTRAGRWRLAAAWGLACAAAAGTYLWPIASIATRSLLIASFVGVWAGALALWWRSRPFRWTLLGLTAVAAAWLCLPGHKADAGALRAETVRSLRGYEGTPYVWGGENRLGIDCSGLVRRGLIDANWRLGLRTVNPALVREAISLWWNDCSAQRLGEGYGGRARLLARVPDLNGEAAAVARPGDFAVTESGVHTLACIGYRAWIEADPGEGGVIVVRTPSTNPWFGQSMALMRWGELE